MSLPILWIERIFTKLSLAYGRDFLGRWEGMPISEVKTDWAECLKGFADHPQAIAFALSNLPDSKPPTAQEFRALCRQAPQVPSNLLTASKADESVVEDQLRKMASSAFKSPVNERGETDHKRWARKLRERHGKGEKLNLFQINSYRNALGIKSSA